MDVLQLHQSGIENVVSSSGTALTVDQARILKRYSDNLLMIYDADTAGQNAMIKALGVTLSEGLNVRLLHLPDGDDPDSYVQKHGHFTFEEYIKKNATDFLNFLVQKAEREDAWNDPIRSGEYVKLILQQIALVPDAIVRETMVQHLSQRTRIGDRTLFAQLKKLVDEKKADQAAPPKMPKTIQAPNQPISEPQFEEELVHPDMRPYEKEVLRLMIQYGRPMVDYVGKLINADHFTHPLLIKLFNELIRRYQEEENFDLETLTRLPAPFPSLMSEIFIERESPSEKLATRSGRVLSRDSDPYASVKGALKALKIHYLERMIDKVEEYIRELQNSNGEEYQQARQKEIEIKRVRHAFLSKPDSQLFPPSPKPEKDELFGA
jgi:DNA primase